ncbi:Uncharacterized protein dnm_029940 [Desulfonema magnum]|uniref:Uncharacterized protein n=1 Tax=Desulfonema magnum TaxID=45655 RepID=A0A975GMQ5_9BACT|nr:Uncharacterized protein dnm_029940 [Desulfonema magnum]
MKGPTQIFLICGISEMCVNLWFGTGFYYFLQKDKTTEKPDKKLNFISFFIRFLWNFVLIL